MTKCDQEGCQGHLAKFPSCLAEALWELGMGGWGESTGRTEAYGHFTAITPDAEDVEEPYDLEGVSIMIPAGFYMIMEDDRGFVDLVSYSTEEDLDEAFKIADQRYGEWLEINEPG